MQRRTSFNGYLATNRCATAMNDLLNEGLHPMAAEGLILCRFPMKSILQLPRITLAGLLKKIEPIFSAMLVPRVKLDWVHDEGETCPEQMWCRKENFKPLTLMTQLQETQVWWLHDVSTAQKVIKHNTAPPSNTPAEARQHLRSNIQPGMNCDHIPSFLCFVIKYK